MLIIDEKWALLEKSEKEGLVRNKWNVCKGNKNRGILAVENNNFFETIISLLNWLWLKNDLIAMLFRLNIAEFLFVGSCKIYYL